MAVATSCSTPVTNRAAIADFPPSHRSISRRIILAVKLGEIVEHLLCFSEGAHNDHVRALLLNQELVHSGHSKYSCFRSNEDLH
jgi:hypothetical protein